MRSWGVRTPLHSVLPLRSKRGLLCGTRQPGPLRRLREPGYIKVPGGILFRPVQPGGHQFRFIEIAGAVREVIADERLVHHGSGVM